MISFDFSLPHSHLQMGDHLTRELQYVTGLTHHGIVTELGDGTMDTIMVTHYSGEPKRPAAAQVIESTLQEFLGSSQWYRVLHHINYNMQQRQGAVKRAKDAIGSGDGEYHLVANNCESFVLRCIHGTPWALSSQVARVTLVTLVVVGFAFLASGCPMSLIVQGDKISKGRIWEWGREMVKAAVPMRFTGYRNSCNSTVSL